MKTCPECGIELMDEYQFCPEDGTSLAAPPPEVKPEVTAPAKPAPFSAVVLYCPACAAEYPLTFSECPVHHTALVTHGIAPMSEPRKVLQSPPQQEVRAVRPQNSRHLVLMDEVPQQQDRTEQVV